MTDSSMYNFDQLEQQLGALARTMTEDDWRIEAPPADLFSAILADVRSDHTASQIPQSPLALDAQRPTAQPPMHRGTSSPPVDHIQPVPQQVPAQEPVQFEQQPASFSAAEQGSGVASLDDRRQEKASRRSGPSWLLAAAAIAVLAVGGGLLATQFSSNEPSGVTVASATIVNDELPVAFDQSGSAVLVNEDGDLVLDIDVPSLPDSGDAFYEVWMIDTNVEGMISLGVLSADGRIDVPDTINPGDFPVVDVSVEPLDGDPTHSGQSILRGVLDV